MADAALCLHFHFESIPETLNTLECKWRLYEKSEWISCENLLRLRREYHLVVWVYAPKRRAEERRVKGITNKLGISKTHFIPLDYGGDIYDGRTTYHLVKQHDGGLFGKKINP